MKKKRGKQKPHRAVPDKDAPKSSTVREILKAKVKLKVTDPETL